MNWKDCVLLYEKYDIRSRFEWPVGEGRSGFDCNSAFTFNDVWGAVSWLWTWPGDYLLNMAMVKDFFELGPEIIVASGWSTAIGWWIFLSLLAGMRGS